LHPLNPSKHGGPLVVRGYLLFVMMCLLTVTPLPRNWKVASMHAFIAESLIELVYTWRRYGVVGSTKDGHWLARDSTGAVIATRPRLL